MNREIIDGLQRIGIKIGGLNSVTPAGSLQLEERVDEIKELISTHSPKDEPSDPKSGEEQ